MIDYTEVACSTCDAKRGQECVDSQGRYSSSHVARRDKWKKWNPQPNVEERWAGPTDVNFSIRVFENTAKGRLKPTLWLSIELDVHGHKKKIESPVNLKAINDLKAQLNTLSAGLDLGQLVEVRNAK